MLMNPSRRTGWEVKKGDSLHDAGVLCSNPGIAAALWRKRKGISMETPGISKSVSSINVGESLKFNKKIKKEEKWNTSGNHKFRLGNDTAKLQYQQQTYGTHQRNTFVTDMITPKWQTGNNRVGGNNAAIGALVNLTRELPFATNNLEHIQLRAYLESKFEKMSPLSYSFALQHADLNNPFQDKANADITGKSKPDNNIMGTRKIIDPLGGDSVVSYEMFGDKNNQVKILKGIAEGVDNINSSLMNNAKFIEPDTKGSKNTSIGVETETDFIAPTGVGSRSDSIPDLDESNPVYFKEPKNNKRGFKDNLKVFEKKVGNSRLHKLYEISMEKRKESREAKLRHLRFKEGPVFNEDDSDMDEIPSRIPTPISTQRPSSSTHEYFDTVSNANSRPSSVNPFRQGSSPHIDIRTTTNAGFIPIPLSNSRPSSVNSFHQGSSPYIEPREANLKPRNRRFSKFRDTRETPSYHLNTVDRRSPWMVNNDSHTEVTKARIEESELINLRRIEKSNQILLNPKKTKTFRQVLQEQKRNARQARSVVETARENNRNYIERTIARGEELERQGKGIRGAYNEK